MGQLTRQINYALSFAGKKLSRHKRSPYDGARRASRYQRGSVRLLGKPFRYIDEASFRFSYREIFLDQIYRFETQNPAPRILDLGGNIGLSSIYFQHHYPKARITTIEADPNVFGVLKENLSAQGFDSVQCINAAVHDRSGTVTFAHEGADAGRLTEIADETPIAEASELEVPCMMLDDLIDGPIDFLKMDIEGAEIGVLSSTKKLGQVNQMFLEYHSFSDRPQHLAKVFEVLESSGFRCYARSQFCPNNPLVHRETQYGMDLQMNLWCVRDAIAKAA